MIPSVSCIDCNVRCHFIYGGDSPCVWNYNGQGIEYQILAGPSYILAFSVGGIVTGILSDRYNR